MLTNAHERRVAHASGPWHYVSGRRLYSVYPQNINCIPLFLRCLLLDLRNDVLAKHLNRRHDLVVRDRLRRHQELQLIDPNSLMEADRLETALRITGHEDTTLHQCIGIEL